MDPLIEEASTPPPQWTAPQPWWAGMDSDRENNESGGRHGEVQSNSNRWDQDQPISTNDTTEGLRQPMRVGRNPRSIFGDLPNSSYNADILADPIQRELERREVEQQRPSVAGAVTWSNIERVNASVEMSGGSELGGHGENNIDFWREECVRLHSQLASLARERERWECDRKHLLDRKADRCELAGLRRAVEAQSQLVMENLVVAQRLAAVGSTMPAGPATLENALQTIWVDPRVRETSPTYGPRFAPIDSHRQETVFSGRREMNDTKFRRDTADHQAVETSQFRHNELGHSVPKTGATTRQLLQREAERSIRPWESPRSPEEQVQTNWSSGSGYGVDTVGQRFDQETGGGANSFSDPREETAGAAVSRKSPRLRYQHPLASNSSRAPRHSNTSYFSSAKTPDSRDDVLALQIPLEAPSTDISKVYDNHGWGGWNRVSSGGNDVYSGAGAKEGESEVWEWNGRRVVIQKSSQKRLLVRPEQTTNTGQKDGARIEEQKYGTPHSVTEAATAGESVVSASVLDDIQEIKAAVQTLAGAMGVGPVPQADEAPKLLPAEKITESSSPSTSHTRQPRLPEEGSQTSESSAQYEAPPSRRISFALSPVDLKLHPGLKPETAAENTDEDTPTCSTRNQSETLREKNKRGSGTVDDSSYHDHEKSEVYDSVELPEPVSHRQSRKYIGGVVEGVSGGAEQPSWSSATGRLSTDPANAQVEEGVVTSSRPTSTPSSGRPSSFFVQAPGRQEPEKNQDKAFEKGEVPIPAGQEKRTASGAGPTGSSADENEASDSQRRQLDESRTSNGSGIPTEEAPPSRTSEEEISLGAATVSNPAGQKQSQNSGPSSHADAIDIDSRSENNSDVGADILVRPANDTVSSGSFTQEGAGEESLEKSLDDIQSLEHEADLKTDKGEGNNT